MGGAEGVMHEDVAQTGQLVGQLGLVFLLAHIQAAVFEQHDLPGLYLDAVDPVAHEGNLAPQQLRKALCHGCQRILRLEGAFGGTAEVAGDHDGCAAVERHADRRQRGPDAGVLGDVACVIQRHVEVGADEDAFALGLALVAQVGEADEWLHGGHGLMGDDERKENGTIAARL